MDEKELIVDVGKLKKKINEILSDVLKECVFNVVENEEKEVSIISNDIFNVGKNDEIEIIFTLTFEEIYEKGLKGGGSDE